MQNETKQLDLFSKMVKEEISEEVIEPNRDRAVTEVKQVTAFGSKPVVPELEPDVVVEPLVAEQKTLDSNISQATIPPRKVIKKVKASIETINKAKEEVTKSLKELDQQLDTVAVEEKPKLEKVKEEQVTPISVVKEQVVPPKVAFVEKQPELSQELKSKKVQSYTTTREIYREDDSMSGEVRNAKTDLLRIIKEKRYNSDFKSLEKKFKKGTLVKADGFYFHIYKKMLMLVDYKGTSSDIEIPAYISNLPVRYISPSAFKDSHIVKKTDKNILGRLFRNKLEKFSDSVNIYNERFEHVVIRFPNTLLTIPNGLLDYIPGLSQIVVPPNVKEIGVSAFSKSSVQSVYMNCPKPSDFEYLDYNRSIFVKQNVHQTYNMGEMGEEFDEDETYF